MDELLIEDKRYVSSKRAAKITGYAKDYIGQLCREGRVPARLVGRSWYVLETAIQDHRFGSADKEPVIEEKPTFQPHTTWEAPRYESSEADVLPTLNRLKDEESSIKTTEESISNNDSAQHIQDTWKTWFERFDSVADAESFETTEDIQPAPEPVKEEYVKIQEKDEIEQNEVQIPIRTIYRPQYQPVHEEPSEREIEVLPTNIRAQVVREDVATGMWLIRTIQLSGAVIAVVAASMAVIGSGYFDEYIASNSQISAISGVILYNK
ncbi:MAG: hypothetical protein Q8L30_00385 [bacterium]|nr:hypothetical protein [bacterium]